MKLRTSFFDKATFKKDITRYWPIWVLYTVLLLMLMLPTVTGSSWGSPAVRLNTSLEAWAIGNFLYAALVSQLLFGDLFNARLCYALHAMPATRTARFISHISAGMLFALVPDLICAVVMIPALESQLWFTSLIWLAMMMLEYLCFFGIGVLSAVCTGKRLAAVAVYTILNFFSLVIYYFAGTVIVPMMYGVVLYADPFLPFSPVATLSTQNDYFRISGDFYNSLHRFEGLGEAFPYLCIASAVGAVLLAVSWLLYRRRKLESAGAFITSKWLSPVFLTLYTLCAGAFLPIFSSIFVIGSDDYAIPLIVGLIAGFFTGKMLLERTIRIFRKSTFIQFAAVVLIAVAGLWCVKADVFGIVSYVPETEEIASVTFNSSKELTQTDKIEMVQEVHRWILQKKCDGRCGNGHERFSVTYTLKNGRTVNRFYHLCLNKETNFLRNWLHVTEYFPTQEDVAVVNFFLDGVQFRDFSYNERWVIWCLQQWILKTRCDGNCGSKHSTLSFTYRDKKVTVMSFTYQLCINQETESLLGILRYYNDPYSPSPEQFYRVTFTEVDQHFITQKSRYETTTTEGIAAYVQVYEWALEHACGEECGAGHTLYTVNFYSQAYATYPVYTFRLCDNMQTRAMLELLKTYDDNA